MSRYKTQSVQVNKEVSDTFSMFLFWWGEIRKYYKDNTYYAICLDLMHQNVMDNFFEIEEQTNQEV